MSSHHSTNRVAVIHIHGMTCGSCELLLERKLSAVASVLHADVNHRTGTAIITANADALPLGKEIERVIRDAGYGVGDEQPKQTTARHASKATAHTEDPQRKWLEIGASLIIIFAAYKVLQAFDLVSLAPAASEAVSFGGIFIIGLVAGASSCLAVAGGLLLALAAKHNEMHHAKTAWHKAMPLLHFNIGRLVSYFVLGGIVGTLGQSITLSTQMSGYVSIAVALVMLWLALSILQIIPRGSFPIQPPKKLARWIANLAESDHPAAPFALGAFTFFLPCGFTQSLQLVALASGSFLTGGLTMLIFALGTLPSLVGLSALSSTATGNFSRIFLRFSGALVLLLAIFNAQNGLALTGLDFSRVLPVRSQMMGAPTPPAGIQEVSLSVTRSGYVPNNLTIRAGMPVRWKIDGTGATGCTSVMTIPSMNISQALRPGENIIEFTAPSSPGTLAFMCSMGMVRGSFTII